MIPQTEYLERMSKLQGSIQLKGLDAFLVTSKESIYYLTGVTYEPLERPFFILVSKEGKSELLTPALEQEHLRIARMLEPSAHIGTIHQLSGRVGPERLHELANGVSHLGIEPSLPQEIAARLSQHNPLVFPLIEELRLVKSQNEIAMLRQAARFVKKGMHAIIAAAYYGVSEIEIFSLGRSIQREIIKTTDFDPLNTSVTTAAWPARLALQPHGIPLLDDRLRNRPAYCLEGFYAREWVCRGV